MNSKLNPPYDMGLIADEITIFKRYATWFVFPSINRLLLILNHVFCFSGPILFLILILLKGAYIVTLPLMCIVLGSLLTVPRLSPEFLKKNANRGITQQELEFEIFQSILEKSQSYYDRMK